MTQDKDKAKQDKAKQDFKQEALDYHKYPTPGKISVRASKTVGNQRDLSLAYSPGVAFACEAIVDDPATVNDYTSRANLVGVITNGTAVLGLGDIGPLASKPVMEGKAVLFKSFANIDCFDIEISEKNPDKLIDIIASLEPTFGGINLEDIKAPECFYIEQKLCERMNIPVFHDDQHGTAIIVSAALRNALEVVKKDISKVKLVTSGAGAAALACIDLLIKIGFKKENITLTDLEGVVYKGRTKLMDPLKEQYVQDTKARTLAEVIIGADIFLGLSAGGVLKPEMVKTMADKPIIFALANPTPEITPDEAKKVRPDAIIATGRTDFPNQVNNVLCFPFIFRGALDAGAKKITEEMRLACVNALADLAKAEASEVVARAYNESSLIFGPEYLIPKPFDPRLISKIAPAVAKAAMKSGVATREIKDFVQYENSLVEFVFRSGLVMRPIFAAAKQQIQRVVYSEGEDVRVLRAVQAVVDDRLAKAIIIGRRRVVEQRIKRLGLRLKEGPDFELVDPENDSRYKVYCDTYHKLMKRKGVSPEMAKKAVRTDTLVIGALMMYLGEADAVIGGSIGRYQKYVENAAHIIGYKENIKKACAMNALILPTGTIFITDTYVNPNPTTEELVDIVLLAAEEVRQFGITPRIAMISHSNFGTNDDPSASKMREAMEIVSAIHPELEIDGEMQADAALNPELRARILPESNLKGAANILVMPNIDAANISFNMIKCLGDGISIGPILLGLARPIHILTPSATARGIVNMTAIACVDAQNLSRDAKITKKTKVVNL